MSNPLESPIIVDPYREAPRDEVNIIVPGGSPTVTSKVQSFAAPELHELGSQLNRFLEMLPEWLALYYRTFKKPLAMFGTFCLALLVIAIASGVLQVINSLPLIKSTLQLVGLGYLSWFVWRYLLYAETRQELLRQYHHFMQKVTGRIGDME